MTVKEFLVLSRFVNKSDFDAYQIVRPRCECKDGFSMSVQAGFGCYCYPRVSGSLAYYSVEIGYPSAEEKLLLKYADNENDPTDTVYGYVPIGLVEKVIKKHGGMDDERMLKILNDWSTRHNLHREKFFKKGLEAIRYW